LNFVTQSLVECALASDSSLPRGFRSTSGFEDLAATLRL
jgi:hypothetical protein